MRRKSPTFCLRSYLRDPDFWVFFAALLVSPMVFKIL